MPYFAGDAESSRAGKIALRNLLLAARNSRPTPDRLTAAASLQAVLLSLVRAQHPPTIAGYVPVGSEPGGADLPDVLMSALPPGGRLLLPVLLDDGDLDWVVYAGSLVRGPRGLLEPEGARLGVQAIRAASLIVVPALAVSRTGVRLGRGGGSYDRALSRLAAPASPAPAGPSPAPAATAPAATAPAATAPAATAPAADVGSAGVAFTVALLYDGELMDTLPAESHDRTVSAAITPSGGLALSRASE